MVRKHVLDDEKCVFCGTEVEDLVHTLFYCPFVVDCWNQDVPTLKSAGRVNTFTDLAS